VDLTRREALAGILALLVSPVTGGRAAAADKPTITVQKSPT
jgi:hypothetical protein